MAMPQDQIGVRPASQQAVQQQQQQQEGQQADDTNANANAGAAGEGEGEGSGQAEPTTAELQARLDRAEQLLQGERDQSKFWKGQVDRIQGALGPVNGDKDKGKKPALKLGDNPFTTLADPEQFSDVLESWAQEHGFMSETQVKQLLTEKVAEVGKLGGYYSRNPELNDEKSIVYKAAQRAGEWIAKQPEYSSLSEAAKTMLALEMAEQHTIGIKQADQIKDQANQTRITKAKKQAGPTGGGGAAGGGGNQGDELTAEQKRAAANMGVTEEQYRKHATLGVTMMRRPGGSQ